MRLALPIILFACLWLAGCGQKGPLYLPDWMRPPPPASLAMPQAAEGSTGALARLGAQPIIHLIH